MKHIFKYFLAEAQLPVDEDQEELQKDETEQKSDPLFLLKEDLAEMIGNDEAKNNSLSFVFDKGKPKYAKSWGIVYNATGRLNKAQKKAIRYGLKSDMLAVAGPPGNGKSEMITGLLINAILRDQKVMIASHNNKAVDSVAEKIESIGIPELFIRTGNNKYKKSIAEYFWKINISKNAFFYFWRIAAIIFFFSPKIHRKYARAKAQKLILKKAKYIPKMQQWAEDGKTGKATRALFEVCYGWGLTNLSIRSNFKLDEGMFDLLIVDEAAQCLVGPVLPLMYRAKRVVAVGDQNQLKPIIKDEELREKMIKESDLKEDKKELLHYSESFFDLVVHTTGREPLLLDEHYRCHPEIIDFNNRFFYNGKLKIKTVATKGNSHGMFWIDSKLEDEGFTNHTNLKEVTDVCNVVKHLHDEFGISYDDIGVITPFSKQERELAKGLREISEELLCGTVYKFQGSEKDFIIMSLCLHEKMKEGTKRWADKERSMINVATSRAKKGLIIVADMDEATGREHHIKSLAEYYKSLKKPIV